MTQQHQQLMRQAIAAALQNVQEGKGGPFGALVVKDGQVIAVGTNGVTTTNDPTAHAEVVAIRRACSVLGTFQLTGCELYTTCEPCPMCLGAIYWARPDKVYYASTQHDAAQVGFDDAFIYDEIATPYQQRRIPFEQLLPNESAVIFEAWTQSVGKIAY